jgi:hypothetical protein
MDYFVPQLLNTVVGEAEAEVHAVVDAFNAAVIDPTPFIAADAQQRTAIVRDRYHRFGIVFETLIDKYSNARRTQALLDEIASGQRGFVLMLRGFSLKEQFDAVRSIGQETDMEGYSFRFGLARNIAPAPLVLVRNPSESESLIGVFPDAEKAAANTFSLDLDSGWEASVRTLIGMASFIVVRNKVMSEGLITELGLLKDAGRLDDALFSHPAEAARAFPGTTLKEADAATVASRGSLVAPRSTRSGRMPFATCWWVQAARRTRIRESVLFVYDLLNQFAARGAGMPRDIQARLLAFAVAGSILLERLDLVVMSLGSFAQVVASFSAEQLPARAQVAEAYMAVARDLVEAIEATPKSAAVFDYDDLDRIRGLMEQETPEILIPHTMRVLAYYAAHGNTAARG